MCNIIILWHIGYIVVDGWMPGVWGYGLIIIYLFLFRFHEGVGIIFGWIGCAATNLFCVFCQLLLVLRSMMAPSPNAASAFFH